MLATAEFYQKQIEATKKALNASVKPGHLEVLRARLREYERLKAQARGQKCLTEED